MQKTTGSRGSIDWEFLGVIALAGVVVVLFWMSPLVYPIRLFVTIVHELSHAIATIATGGEVSSIAISPDASGLAMVRGGLFFIHVPAGYLGSVLFGSALLILAKRGAWSRGILAGLGVALIVAVLLLVRNPFGIFATLILAAAFIALAKWGPDWLLRFSLYLLAMLNCVYAVRDLITVVFLSQVGIHTDAALMAQYTGIPSIFWALLWFAMGVVAIFFVGKRLVRN